MRYLKSRKKIAVMLIALLAIAIACAEDKDEKVIKKTNKVNLSSLKETNLIDFHAGAKASDNLLCIACHGDMSDESAVWAPTIAGPHKIHSNKTNLICTDCHKTTDLLQKSGAQLRTQVSTSRCIDCHDDVLYPGL